MTANARPSCCAAVAMRTRRLRPCASSAPGAALGQGSAAEAAYREVLRMAPADLPARNNLALLMARRGCRTEALAMLQSARTAAANGPLAAEIADSLREIQALATPATPAASCP